MPDRKIKDQEEVDTSHGLLAQNLVAEFTSSVIKLLSNSSIAKPEGNIVASLEHISAQVLSAEEAIEQSPVAQHIRQPLRWVPDEAVTNCASCKYKFNLFVRKHHCRLCGDIFCNSCAKPRKWHETEARICDACWKLEQKPEVAPAPVKQPDVIDDLVLPTTQPQEPKPKVSELW